MSFTTASVGGNFNIGLFNSTSSWNNSTVTNSIVKAPTGITFNSNVKIKSNAPIIEVGQDPTTALGVVTLQLLQSYAQPVGSYEVTTNKDASNGYAGLTLFKINFKNALNTFTSFFTNTNTASRTYTFKDADVVAAL